MVNNIPRPMSSYFLIKLPRKKEKDAKEKIGSIYIPVNEALMQYNLPSGEIVAIGEKAAEYFPEAKVGHQLLLHHFVQGMGENEAKADTLVHQDDEFNYYVVTAFEHNGKGVEAYGVWDGEKIIPNKDYVFLSTEKVNHDLPYDEMVNQSLEVTESGLLVFKEWEETRESKESRQNMLKKEVEDLSKSGTHKEHIQKAIAMKEMEMGAISQEINKKKYKEFRIAFANPELSEWFGRPVGTGDKIATLNIAAYTKFEFMGEEYIVSKTKYIAFLYND